MALAGLNKPLGNRTKQVCITAEIDIDHNLKLTCNSVARQVQVPCIERNTISSVKTITQHAER